MKARLANITVHYESCGAGIPLVLLHGYWTDHRQMMGCMEPLFINRDGWNRIYPDLPGMGMTQDCDWIINSDQILEVVCDFIDHLIPQQRFVLGGYSYGGYLGQGVVHQRSELVDGLLLICPVVIARIRKRTLPNKTIFQKDQDLGKKLTQEEKEILDSWVAIQDLPIWERTRDEINIGRSMANRPFLKRLWEEGSSLSFEQETKNHRFEIPTLILTGKQDWLVGYEDSWQLMERYPEATFVVFDKAGHNLPIVQEKLFNSLTSEWLNRVEESRRSA